MMPARARPGTGETEGDGGVNTLKDLKDPLGLAAAAPMRAPEVSAGQGEHPDALDPVLMEAGAADSLMRLMRGSQWPSIGATAVFALALWLQSPSVWVLLWAAAHFGVGVVWILVIQNHFKRLKHATPTEKVESLHRLRFLWTLNGALWGLSLLLFVDLPAGLVPLMGWLLLSCYGAFGMYTLSPHRPTLRLYIHALSGAATLAYAVHLLGIYRAGTALMWDEVALLPLIVCLWGWLWRTGEDFHAVHAGWLELQHRNARLIQSLRAQTEAALHAVEVKNLFLAKATHDIRQPVHALRMYADWLSSEPELVGEIAPKILKSTAAVNALFNNLFDLSRLDTGEARPQPEPVSIRQLLVDLDVQYRPLAEAKGLDFRVRLPRQADHTIDIDRLMLLRILSNLLMNAIRFTDHGGVLLAWRRAGGRCRLEVWDTGPGIPAHEQAAVFREFHKLPGHPGTEDSFGLGLAIVTRLAALLRLRVSMASRVGRGTVFRVQGLGQRAH